MATLLLLLACKPDAGLTKFNSEPEAQITAPADGAAVLEGSTVTLRGQASDANHDASELLARWFVGEDEACASAPPAADGTTTCDVRVPDGATMDVRLEVVDPDGAGGVAAATYAVTPNADPVPTIQSPVADGVYYSDQLITFRGTVSDAEDGPEALSVWWEDGATRLDAVEATPTSSGEVLGYALLSEGAHALELHVLDSAGNEGIATVLIDVGPPNSAPACAITAPASGGASEQGEVVAFSATVSDVDVPASLLSVAWESDKDGPLGTSAPDSAGNVSFRTSDLSANEHRVTLTVTDELGASCVAGLDWTVATPPTIDLERPASDEVANEGDTVTFTALVSDGEDVPGDLWVTWESSLDGLLYEGPPDSSGVAAFLSDGLSVGDHALTVTVTDTAGLNAIALGTFTINGLPTAPGVTLAPASPDTDDDLRVTIASASVDPEGDPVSYAYVWYVDGTVSSASTSATLPASATRAGEVWTVAVTATDGLGAGPAGTASVTIQNSAPDGTVSLTPSAPTRTSTLTCSAGGTDADGDALSHTFTWTVDGAPVTASSTSSTLSTLAGVFAASQLVACTVSTDDGKGGTDTDSASVTVVNTAPTVSVSLSPATVYTDDTLTASATAADGDGDALTVTYDWYVDGTLVQSGASATLDGASSFDRDEEVYVVATVDDGTDTASATSASVTVSNTAPTAPVIDITPADAASGDDLTCSVVTESTDADGDAITYTFVWDVDGVAYTDATDAAMSSVVDGANVGGGEVWTCEVGAGDGVDSTYVREGQDVACVPALDFAGVGTVDIATDASVNLSTEYSLGLWLYVRSDGSATLVSDGLSGTYCASTGMRLGYSAGTRVPYAFSHGGAGSDRCEPFTGNASPSGAVAKNIWTHLLWTVQGSRSVFYVNGVAASTSTVTSVDPFTPFRSLMLGYEAGDAERLDGALADVALWNRALSVEEAFDVFYARPSEVPDGLVAWWPLDEGVGAVVGDALGSGMDGLATSTSWTSRCADGSTGSP
jgi:hypothetical protein